MTRTIYQKKEWKAKRDMIITENSICVWCGSKEKLAPHHIKNKIPQWQTIRFNKFLKSKYNIPRAELKGEEK